MKSLNDYKLIVIFVGFVAAMVFGGGNAKADFTFGEPTNLGPTVNSSTDDMQPTISADGLSLFFHSDRTGGSGNSDLWVTTRNRTDENWGEPVNLGPTVNSSQWEYSPSLSADGLSLFFASNRSGGSGGYDLWVTTRATTQDDWGNPVNLGPTVNSSYRDLIADTSAEGLSLFFMSDRPGGYGDRDLWVTTRPTKDDEWGTPVNLGPRINTPYSDRSVCISPDGSTLYFQSNRPDGVGGYDLWQAPIIPIVDFNGDGIVDSVDMCIMVDHWGEDYSLCDIGPMPWGDGIVDVQDLIVLSEHLFEDVNDPTVVAHWPLDEAEGDSAYDSAGLNDAFLIGGPLWQPTGGAVDGALEFDGIDDHVSTPFVLDPAVGAFSVIAWIKGGAPGHAILSQASGVNWLCMDSVDGYLMTELKNSGRSSVGPMLSQAIITDGQWHRIGFVWDGSYRRLYVDGAEVANDAAPLSDLESAEGGLYFGAGTTLTPGTYFSGLIDDVRIYNRAVKP